MIVVVLIFSLTALLQVPALIKDKYWRELIVFSIFYIISLVICSLYALDFAVPSVNDAIQYLIEDILHLSYPLK